VVGAAPPCAIPVTVGKGRHSAMMRNRIPRHHRRWLLAPLVLLFLSLHALIVTAHAEYRSSVPANGATIATVPAQVIITFSQETSATHSNGVVTDTAGNVVSTGWSVDLNERTKMTIPLTPNLGNGIYTVTYTSLSEDGHQVDGSFIFTVDPAAANAAAVAKASTGGGAPWGLWLAIFSVTTIVVVGGLFAILRSRTASGTAVARTASSLVADERGGVQDARGDTETN